MNRKLLLDALEELKPGLSTNENIEQATDFIFLNDRIIAYNDEIYISKKFENLGITGAVNAQHLLQLLKKLKTEYVDISTSKSTMTIKSKRATAELLLKTEITNAIDEIEKPKEWQTINSEFVLNLAVATTCASKDLSRPIMTCVHVKRNGTIEASDGQQAVRIKNEIELSKSFLLPSKVAAQISKYPITEMSIGSSWVHFKTNDLQISCKVYKEKFPEMKNIFELTTKETLELSPTISSILERARVFANSPTIMYEFVKLHFEKNKVVISSQNEYGTFTEYTMTKYDKKESLDFYIQPMILAQLLSQGYKNCVYEQTKMKFKSDNIEYVLNLQPVEEKSSDE